MTSIVDRTRRMIVYPDAYSREAAYGCIVQYPLLAYGGRQERFPPTQQLLQLAVKL